MEFKNIKNIVIPDGNVTRITRKTDNVVLWQKNASDYVDYFDSETGYGGKTGAGSYTIPFYSGTYDIIMIGGGGATVGDIKSYDSNWWKVCATGGSSPLLHGRFTLYDAVSLTISVGDNTADSSMSDSGGTISMICPHGNSGSTGAWYSSQGTGGAAYTIDSSWSGITHTGVSAVSKNDGPSGTGSGVVGVFSSWDQNSSDYANSAYPYGCSSASGNGTNGNNRGYVRIWR